MHRSASGAMSPAAGAQSKIDVNSRIWPWDADRQPTYLMPEVTVVARA